MSTKEIARHVRLTRWAQNMRARSESGESVRDWCRANGINEKTYYYWQRKLREAACEGLVESTSLIAQKPARFTQVSLIESAANATPAQADTDHNLHAEIGGVHITVSSEYPMDKLALLLRELSPW